jgi:hypothetical protein
MRLPNKGGAGNGARALCFQVERFWRAVPDLIRSATRHRVEVSQLLAGKSILRSRVNEERRPMMMKSSSTLIGRLLYRFVGVSFVSFASLCLVRADVPRETRTAQDLIERILRDEMPQLQQKSKTSRGALETYDLMQATDDIMRKITAGPEYSAYVEQRKASLSREELSALDPKTQGMWMVEFAQSRADVKPEIKAWLYVFSGLFAPWDQALAGYHRLEKYRPNDFVPALLMAFKLQAPGVDPPTVEEWKDVIGIVREALPRATNIEDLTDCVVAVGMGALRMAEGGNAPGVPLLVWQWLRDVELPVTSRDPDNTLRLDLVKMLLAVATKDYLAAVEIAPRCRLRVFQPMFLVFAGKREEAYDRLQELRLNSTLTDPERAGLRKFEPLILMFSQHFGEAWRVIREQRESPNLGAKDSEWLNMVEDLLRNYETGVRSGVGQQR